MSIDFTKMSKKQLIAILRNVENVCSTFEFASKDEINIPNPEWHEGRIVLLNRHQNSLGKLYLLKCKASKTHFKWWKEDDI